MEDIRTVRTTLAAADIRTDDSFLNAFTLYELRTDAHIKGRKVWDSMTAALIALRDIDGGKSRHVVSEAAGSGHGKVFVMYGKKEDPPVRDALKGTNVSGRLIHSVPQVPAENICDLAVKYAVLQRASPGTVLQRGVGIWYKYSEKMALHVYCRNAEGIPGRVAVCAEGANITKTAKTEGTPRPFAFTPEGILVYPSDSAGNIQRYLWKKRSASQKMTKVRAITFGSEEDYGTSQSKLRYMNGFLRLLGETPGISVSPVTWEGERYSERIGEDKEKYTRMDKAAVMTVMENGISVTAGEGIALSGKTGMERYMGILFAFPYTNRSRIAGSGNTKISRIRIGDGSVLAIKAAKKMFFPQCSKDGWTEFDTEGRIVSGITAYTNTKADCLTAELYGEDGLPAGSGILKADESVWATGRSPVRKDGKFILEVIRGKDKEVPYEKSLRTQHITEGTIADNADSLLPLCRNLVYQMVIKDDISRGRFTFTDMSRYAGYEFIIGVKDGEDAVFSSMRITEDGGFTVGKTDPQDEARFCGMEDMKSGEHYAFKPPNGDITVIQDTGYAIMTDLSFSGKDATRSRKTENRMLAPFLDFVHYEIRDRHYYSAGWDLVDSNSQSYTYIPKIRALKVWQDGPLAIETDDFFSMMNVPFVWMAQKNTVIPYPYKYLREYTGTVKANKNTIT